MRVCVCVCVCVYVCVCVCVVYRVYLIPVSVAAYKILKSNKHIIRVHEVRFLTNNYKMSNDCFSPVLEIVL